MKRVEWTEGDVVRKLRDAFGLTLEQLAIMSGASITAINRLETGRTQEPKRKTLAKIADVFSLTGAGLLAVVPQAFEVTLAREIPPQKKGQRKRSPEHRRARPSLAQQAEQDKTLIHEIGHQILKNQRAATRRTVQKGAGRKVAKG